VTETGIGDAGARRGAWRIVVADDHPPYPQTIRQTLESQADLEVLAEAPDGRQALELCRRLAPDLVLMDLVMPGMDGVAATSLIKREYPKTRVLVLTALDETSSLSECLKAGAEGYVLKDAPAERLIDAVRGVLLGGASPGRGTGHGSAHELGGSGD
jgi:DNA-binding NarL/FixJ family response regulator